VHDVFKPVLSGEIKILLVVLSILQVWSAYKDQKHDLFLPSSAQSAAAGVAGLIENSSSRLTYALAAPPQPPQGRPRAPSPSDSNGNQDQLI
jgi:DnaJ family protein C protein 13